MKEAERASFLVCLFALSGNCLLYSHAPSGDRALGREPAYGSLEIEQPAAALIGIHARELAHSVGNICNVVWVDQDRCIARDLVQSSIGSNQRYEIIVDRFRRRQPEPFQHARQNESLRMSVKPS